MQHRNQHNQSPLPVITGAPLDGPADCTLACDEGHLTAHKIMLCAHSKYLQDILGKFPNAEHPIIILTELNITDIKILVNYMYTGELVITNDGSPSSLLRAAQILKIDSLTDFDDEDEQQQQQHQQYQSHNNNNNSSNDNNNNNSNNNNHLAHNNQHNNNNHNQLHQHYQQRSPSPSMSPSPSPSPQMASPPESPQPTQQQQAAITTTTTTTTTTTRSRLQSQQRNHNHHYTCKHQQQHQRNSPQIHRQKMKHQRTIMPQPPSSISPPSQRLTLPAQLSPKRPQPNISVHQQQQQSKESINASNNKIRCHLCNIGLSDVKCLYRHVLTRHLPEKWGYKCEFCDREFSRDDHLMRHYTTKHKNMEFNREKIRETRRLNREMAKNFHDQISKLGGIDSIRNELSL